MSEPIYLRRGVASHDIPDWFDEAFEIPTGDGESEDFELSDFTPIGDVVYHPVSGRRDEAYAAGMAAYVHKEVAVSELEYENVLNDMIRLFPMMNVRPWSKERDRKSVV